MRQQHALLISLLITIGGGVTQVAAAQPADVTQGTMCPICAKANQDDAAHATKAGHTLMRGATNALLGWTDLIRQPAQEVKQGGNVLVGLAHGVGSGAMRTLGGAADVLTFWTPKVHGKYMHFAKNCPVCAGKTQAQ